MSEARFSAVEPAVKAIHFVAEQSRIEHQTTNPMKLIFDYNEEPLVVGFANDENGSSHWFVWR